MPATRRPLPLLLSIIALIPTTANASDTDQAQQNAIFNRPFIVSGQRAALGGYTEANLNYIGEDGVDQGPSFELRRFNIFIFSPIGPRMRFLSELEFEHGTSEIALETALLDLDLNQALTLRAGILLPPIGAFNQAHDGPLWDFIERPLVSTTIIPSTFSEVGAGAHGNIPIGPLDLDYQLYLTQGLADDITDNDTGRADIPSGRAPTLFEADNNNEPAITGRLSLSTASSFELGLSAWYGAYNTYEREGLTIDQRRALLLTALDLAITLPYLQLRGEAALASIDLPSQLATTHGELQWGAHLDLTAPIARFRLLGFDDAQLNLGLRIEHTDHHAGNLQNQAPAGLETTQLTGAITLRPSPETAFKLNYSYAWATDLLNNPPAQRAALQLGLATYF